MVQITADEPYLKNTPPTEYRHLWFQLTSWAPAGMGRGPPGNVEKWFFWCKCCL